MQQYVLHEDGVGEAHFARRIDNSCVNAPTWIGQEPVSSLAPTSLETRMVTEATLNSLSEFFASNLDPNMDGSSSEEDPHIVEAKRRSMIFNTEDEENRTPDVGEWVEAVLIRGIFQVRADRHRANIER